MATINFQSKKNFSEANMRRIISILTGLMSSVSSLEDQCIKEYNDTVTYQKGQIVIGSDGYFYEAKTVATGAWDASKWTKIGTDDITELTVDDVKSYLSLTQDQLETLSKIILDSEVRLDKTWSSSRVYSSIQDAIDTSKAYTLAELGKASGASYRVVSSTGDMTEQKYIYLMSDGSGSYNMYIVEDNGSATQIGNTTISLDDYFTKQEITDNYYDKSTSDGKFATITTVDGKVDKTSIATAISNTPSDEKVASEKAVKTELDGVVKKTDISTTIDGTSTDDTVPTNKAVYNSLINKVNNTIVLTTADEVNSFDRAYQSFIIVPSVAEAVGLPKAPDSTWFCINLSHVKGFKYPSQIAFEYAGIERIMYRTAHNGVWHNWRKIPTTSVADVPKTVVAYDTSVFETGEISYEVINGICYVRIMALKAKSLVNNYEISSIPMPKPKHGLATCPITCDGDGSNIGMFYVDSNFNSVPKCHMYDNVKNGYCTFSYPVAKS